MRQVEFDGHLWTRTAERRCEHCGARTYRISRRTADQLLIAPLPGPFGCNTFVRRSDGPRRLFAVCTRCFEVSFGGDADRVTAWASGTG